MARRFEKINVDGIERERLIRDAVDSFVSDTNKIGNGSGDGKLELGVRDGDTPSAIKNSKKNDAFFGKKGFTINCFISKKNFLKHLEDTKLEFQNPQQKYRNKANFPKLWDDLKSEVELLEERIFFVMKDQTQITRPNLYINTVHPVWKLLRRLCLPKITDIYIDKLESSLGAPLYRIGITANISKAHTESLQSEYGFQIEKRLRQEAEYGFQIEKRLRQDGSTTSLRVIEARNGQGKFREDLLKEQAFCPITQINDKNLLIASHIKPWAHMETTDFERLDPYNGLLLSPTIDKLFDQFLISFTDDKKIIISDLLSKETCDIVGIDTKKIYGDVPIKGREKYLEFHRDNIFKSD